MTVLVTGGTGQVGSLLVPVLRARGHDVLVTSRSARADDASARRLDLSTGAGLAPALDGVRTVVLLHTSRRHPRDVDGEGSARLASAAKAAGVEHLLLLSIVGCDRVRFPYYRAKVVAEQAVAASGTRWTVQRATQFHTLIAEFARRLRLGPVAVVPRGLTSQPVDVRSVVERLADLVGQGPAGRVGDVAGPERVTLAEAVQLLAAPARVRVAEVLLPGGITGGFTGGGILPGGDAVVAGPSFSEWVAQQGRRS